MFKNAGRWLRTIARICVRYRRTHGRWPNLLSPSRFTEKIQWRKLFDLDPAFEVFSDKHAARRFIEERIGAGCLPECLWHGYDGRLIPFDDLRPPYFIKGTHGTGQVIAVRRDPDASERIAIAAQAQGWLSQNHGLASLEPGYVMLRPAIIIEKDVGAGSADPVVEVKALTFGGVVGSLIVVVVDSDGRRLVCHLSRDWKPLGWRLIGDHAAINIPSRPINLPDILATAERLAAGSDHLRIDTYQVGLRLYVGEITVYSHSGLLVFEPDKADMILGDLWEGDFSLGRAIRAMLHGPPLACALR